MRSTSLPPEEEAVERFYEGVQLEGQGNLEKAHAAYTEAILADPTWPKPTPIAEHIYFLYGNHVAAMVDLNRAVDLDPSLASAFYYRGKTFADNYRPDDALLDFSKAIQLEPRPLRRLSKPRRCVPGGRRAGGSHRRHH